MQLQDHISGFSIFSTAIVNWEEKKSTKYRCTTCKFFSLVSYSVACNSAWKFSLWILSFMVWRIFVSSSSVTCGSSKKFQEPERQLQLKLPLRLIFNHAHNLVRKKTDSYSFFTKHWLIYLQKAGHVESKFLISTYTFQCAIQQTIEVKEIVGVIYIITTFRQISLSFGTFH